MLQYIWTSLVAFRKAAQWCKLDLLKYCTPHKGFSEISEDMVQILVMLEVVFAKDSKIENLLCGIPSTACSSAISFKPVDQDDFQGVVGWCDGAG